LMLVVSGQETIRRPVGWKGSRVAGSKRHKPISNCHSSERTNRHLRVNDTIDKRGPRAVRCCRGHALHSRNSPRSNLVRGNKMCCREFARAP
jgi:hypothetical protein